MDVHIMYTEIYRVSCLICDSQIRINANSVCNYRIAPKTVHHPVTVAAFQLFQGEEDAVAWLENQGNWGRVWCRSRWLNRNWLVWLVVVGCFDVLSTTISREILGKKDSGRIMLSNPASNCWGDMRSITVCYLTIHKIDMLPGSDIFSHGDHGVWHLQTMINHHPNQAWGLRFLESQEKRKKEGKPTKSDPRR